jgi:hypothetical protein
VSSSFFIPGVNLIKLWGTMNGEMQKLQVAQKKFTNFQENATYIANIFHTEKYGEMGFQKQAAYLSFV